MIPCSLQLCETSLNLFRSVVLLDHFESLNLVDSLAVSLELLVYRHFNIAENEYQSLGFAGLESDFLIVRSDRRPAVSERVSSLSSLNSLRIMEAVVQTDKGISVCIIAVDFIVYCVECKVVTSVSVFSLVVDSRAANLNSACGEVSLEVCAVILSVPQTPFSK